jgi:DNA-binding NarL/FixJ family response regulator
MAMVYIPAMHSPTNKRPISVLIVDDHPMLRTGLAEAIASQSDMHVAGEAGNGNEAIEQYRLLRPDVTVMDVSMPEMGGVDALVEIRSKSPQARIIMLTTYKADAAILRAVQSGAAGFLLKSTLRNELLDTIRAVHAGQRCIPPEIAMELAQNMGRGPVSPREVEVLQFAAGGRSNREIATALAISEETVKAHMKNVLAKLDANDRTHAVTIALRRGIISL